MGQGDLFSLDAATFGRLVSRTDETELMDLISEIEDTWDEKYRQFCWKCWPEIHQCLTGNRRSENAGPVPLRHCLLGNRHLIDPYGGYIAATLPADEVAELAIALESLDADWLRCQCERLFREPGDDGLPEAWFEEVKELFVAIQTFYRNAATAGRSALFTSDENLGLIYPPRSPHDER